MVATNSVACGYDRASDNAIVVGLVNNMPDAALRTTERQFCELLSEAAQGRAVRVRLFSLPDVPRSSETAADIRSRYEEIEHLWDSRLDGLIVTGTEPRANLLSQEPYWPAFARLVDWAEENTISAIWSCLAAHAAVLRIDSISRWRFNEKLFGLFECERVSNHAILDGVPIRWRVPHSRYNDLPEKELVAGGYQILSRSAGAGADMFSKQRDSLFVFMQGHPEYDGHALVREYRRDVHRFLAGEKDSYPELPRGYFDIDTARTLASFRARALQKRDAEMLSNFPVVQAEAHSWKQIATRIYTNWISFLAHQSYSRPILAAI
jgi:homoserine O-succinyltransferase